MGLSDIVSLTITRDSATISRAGFGTPLILSATADWTERVRSYTDLAGVIADFPDTTGAEYLAASAMFAQSPRPKTIKIGRSALPPTQKYVITVSAVRNSFDYVVDVVGDGVTSSTATGTSDASATNDEIADALVTALNAVVGKNYTAVATGAGGSHVVTVTATAAGDWFSLEVADPTALSVEQTHADPGVATDLAAIALADNDWYCLQTNYNSPAYVHAAEAWVETQAKIYVYDVNETEAITTVVGNADTLDALHTSAYARSSGWYHPSPANMLAAALMGRLLSLDPGAETWNLKTLAGVDPVALTATHEVNLRARNANSYRTIAGLNVTFDGKVGSGEFIDVERGLDWLTDDMTKAVFGAMAGANKVPYTNAGIALVEAQIRGSLKRAVARGVLADYPKPAVTVPDVADVSTVDKAARLLPDVKFSATLAGAIHKVEINGTVST